MASINIIGYKFLTEQSGIDAIESLNVHYGLPQSATDETQDWCFLYTADMDNPTFWYISFDESMRVVLGNPETFDVTYPDPYQLDGYVGA